MRFRSFCSICLLVSVFLSLLAAAARPSPAWAQANYPIPDTEWTRLTTNPWDDGKPTWSPSGNRIAWVQFTDSWNRNIEELVVANPSDHRSLTDGLVDEFPDYSPDGTKLLYGLYYNDSRLDIVVKDLSTGYYTVLRSTGYNIYPRWSPDGTEIAFSCADHLEGTYHIYKMDADGGNITQLTTGGWINRHPDWSPDGSQIVFGSDRAGSARNERSDVYIMDAGGDDVSVRYLREGHFPRWSPHGSHIAFFWEDHIYVMSDDGTGVVQITAGEYEKHPAWAPDGWQIAFAALVDGNLDIYTVPMEPDYQEDDPAITYTGNWRALGCPPCSAGGLMASRQRTAQAELAFEGTGIRWYAVKGSREGIARIYVDGDYRGPVDLYSPTQQVEVVWEKLNLLPGPHTFAIEVTGRKNPASSDSFVNLDAFDVVP